MLDILLYALLDILLYILLDVLDILLDDYGVEGVSEDNYKYIINYKNY